MKGHLGYLNFTCVWPDTGMTWIYMIMRAILLYTFVCGQTQE